MNRTFAALIPAVAFAVTSPVIQNEESGGWRPEDGFHQDLTSLKNEHKLDDWKV
jgi:hypothetical protein